MKRNKRPTPSREEIEEAEMKEIRRIGWRVGVVRLLNLSERFLDEELATVKDRVQEYDDEMKRIADSK